MSSHPHRDPISPPPESGRSAIFYYANPNQPPGLADWYLSVPAAPSTRRRRHRRRPISQPDQSPPQETSDHPATMTPSSRLTVSVVVDEFVPITLFYQRVFHARIITNPDDNAAGGFLFDVRFQSNNRNDNDNNDDDGTVRVRIRHRPSSSVVRDNDQEGIDGAAAAGGGEVRERGIAAGENGVTVCIEARREVIAQVIRRAYQHGYACRTEGRRDGRGRLVARVVRLMDPAGLGWELCEVVAVRGD